MRRIAALLVVSVLLLGGLFGCGQEKLSSFQGLSVNSLDQGIKAYFTEMGYETDDRLVSTRESLDIDGKVIEEYRLELDDTLYVDILCYEKSQRIVVTALGSKEDKTVDHEKFHHAICAIFQTMMPQLDKDELMGLLQESIQSGSQIRYEGYRMIYHQTVTSEYVLISEQ